MKFSKSGLSICTALVLAACGTTPQKVETRNPPAPVVEEQPAQQPKPAAPVPGSGGYLAGDGPGTNAPVNMDAIPDAVPHNEPLHLYANRQYAALGKIYTPLTVTGSYKERGIASWYGKKFNGQRTSSGEAYDMYAMTAAHPTLPIPSYARVTNLANNKSVVVRINDRGPFLHDRIIDLSYTAAHKLGLINDGSSEVEVESIATDTAVVAPIAMAEPVKSAPLPPDPVAVVASGSVVAVAASAAAASSVASNAAASNPGPSSSAVSNAAAPGAKVYLQLGAFKLKERADNFLARMRTELGDIDKPLSLFVAGGLVRVHVGPYASKDEAGAIAEKLQARLGFKPMVSVH
ncbi:MAG: septal ring lytic transglycosylase RlpA family protein [Gallionellaceae bacterium]